MALSLKHVFASGKADGVDASLVQPSGWNQEHALTMATGFILGRTTAGTGAVQEISVGSGLALAAGVLSANPSSAFSTLSVSGVATFGGGKTIDASGNASFGNLSISGSASFGNAITLTGTALYISMVDTDWGTRQIHSNGGLIGFLSNAGGWTLQCADNGDLTATGNVGAYSDARLKKDVSTIGNALGLVEQMRGVYYTRIDSGVQRVGVIAQEMQKVLPQVIMEDAQGVLAVSYGDLVGVLIQAVNELTARVRELEGRA